MSEANHFQEHPQTLPIIWIDADGCPVVAIAIKIAKKYNLPVTLVKNIHHRLDDDYARVITVDGDRDSADFYIVNRLKKNDVVITQDNGLAAMALARGALVINQHGTIIDDSNIDILLDRRHMNQELRRKHKQYTGSKFKKRTPEDDLRFEQAFSDFIIHLKSVE